MTIAELLAQWNAMPPVGFQNEAVVWAEGAGAGRAMAIQAYLIGGGSSDDVLKILAAIARATEPEIPEGERHLRFFPDRFIDLDPVFKALKGLE